jgi:VanZ family protein
VSDVRSLVDARVGLVAVALITLCTATCKPLAVKLRRPWWLVLASLLAASLVVALTLANRGLVASDDPIGVQLTWWARRWDYLPDAFAEPGWWLNVALFFPVALLSTVVVGRPRLVLASAVAGSFLIETAQATVLTGIADPADLIANAVGAAIAVAASAWMANRSLGRR